MGIHMSQQNIRYWLYLRSCCFQGLRVRGNDAFFKYDYHFPIMHRIRIFAKLFTNYLTFFRERERAAHIA